MKRSVDSDHVAQRAYIFGGGPHGRSDDAIVHGAIENDGRTPGFLKRVDWGICDEEAFPKNVRVSEIIDKELVPKGVINTVEGVEDVYPPTPKGQLYRQIEFERAPNIGKIFFGPLCLRRHFPQKTLQHVQTEIDRENRFRSAPRLLL